MVLNKVEGIRTIIYLIPFFLMSCSTSPDSKGSGESVSILWRNHHATAIAIPREYFSNAADDSLNHLLTVHLAGATNAPAILGEYVLHEDHVRFEPLIPFTRKSKYEVRLQGVLIADITIPEPDESEYPVLLGIFPTQDTLPQNLLKFYFHFSKPMREGQSLQHIFLLRNEGDTATQVFLDLQPELWNEDRTMLTLWLDPGRIKRDLQPNRMLGEPLELNGSYQLVVNDTWQDVYGSKLKAVTRKIFTVALRDTFSPDHGHWTVSSPRHGTINPLEIDFHENLDYVLLNEGIKVLDENGSIVAGEVKLQKEESVYHFFPSATWKSGTYTVRCEGRIEDLAGNNLNRPFDRDITQVNSKQEQNFYNLLFTIK